MQEWIGEWIGKPLLTRGGARIGYIRSVQTDRALRRILNLECCDEEEEEFLLPYAAVERFGKDAAVVRALAPPREGGVSAPFGRAVYSRAGEKLGTADDFACEGARLTALLLSGGLRLPIGQVVGAGDALIVDLQREGRRTARRTALPRPQGGDAAESEAENAALPAAAREAGTAAQLAPALAEGGAPESAGAPEGDAPPAAAGGAGPVAAAAKEVPAAPQEVPRVCIRPHAGGAAGAETAGEAKGTEATAASGAGDANGGAPQGAPPGRLAGSALLTGKTLPEDLRDARGALLAPRGAVVDAAVIRRALQHNKLFALTCLCTRGQQAEGGRSPGQ